MIAQTENLANALMRTLERRTAGDDGLSARYLALGRNLKIAVAGLKLAAESVRSDDPSIDASVPAKWRNAAVDLPTEVHTIDELWVRIFPDDIAVDTHEESLTALEEESGQRFWQETIDAADDDALERGAWRALCLKHGSRRAAWIARKTKPHRVELSREATNGAGLLNALTTLDRRIDEVGNSKPGERIKAIDRAVRAVVERFEYIETLPPAMAPIVRRQIETIRAKVAGLDARIRDPRGRSRLRRTVHRVESQFARWPAIEQVSLERHRGGLARLEFPNVRLKESTWSRAPQSTVLPKRFVIVAVSGDRVAHLIAGKEIPDDIKLGIDPNPAQPEAERYGLDADGNLVVGKAIRWMVDFDEAVDKGMAVRVLITKEEAQRGFDPRLRSRRSARGKTGWKTSVRVTTRRTPLW